MLYMVILIKIKKKALSNVINKKKYIFNHSVYKFHVISQISKIIYINTRGGYYAKKKIVVITMKENDLFLKEQLWTQSKI